MVKPDEFLLSVTVISLFCVLTTDSQNLTAVNIALSQLPNLVAYWPNTAFYGTSDAKNFSQINGTPSTSLTYTSGPFALSNTAVILGSGSPNRYIGYTSNDLDFIGLSQSFTITAWVNLNFNWQPIFEWVHSSNPPAGNVGTNVGMHMSQFPGTNNLWFNTMNPDGLQMTCNNMTGSWLFVAITYDFSTKRVSLFCNEDFHSVTYNATGHPFSSTKTYLGYSWSGNSVGSGNFACATMHNAALDVFGLIAVKESCKYFAVSCSPGCIAGGVCIGYNICSCTAAYTGPNCNLMKGVPSAINETLASLPNLVGYWPLTLDYGSNDAKPFGSLIAGYPSRPMVYSSGPYGHANTAFQTAKGIPHRYVTFTSNLFNFSTSSFTVAMWVNVGLISPSYNVPIFEWYHPSNPPVGSGPMAAHVYYMLSSPNLLFNSGGNTAEVECVKIGSWHFLAFSYNSSESKMYIFCDDIYSATSPIVTSIMTSNTLLLGYSIVKNRHSNSQYACLSVHSAALTTKELWNVRDACRLFRVSCPGVCQNGASCVGTGVCKCLPGYTGNLCGIPLDYAAYTENHLAALSSVVGFWPLASNWAGKDAGPNQIDGFVANYPVSYGPGIHGNAVTMYMPNSTRPNYVTFDHEALDLGNSSFTLAGWFNNDGSAPARAYFDFLKIPTLQPGFYFWNNGSLYANENGEVGLAKTCTTESANFIATTYNAATKEIYIYCNATPLAGSKTLVAAVPGLSQRLYIGKRYPEWYPANAYVQCLSFHSAALNASALAAIREHCRFYSYICSPPCQNGGTCISQNFCQCTAGWTGRTCGTTVSQFNFIQARITSQFPTLVGYWPLSDDWLGKDAKPSNQIDGTTIVNQYFTTGPFGAVNGAVDLGFEGIINRHVAFNNSQLNFGNSSWTWAGYVSLDALNRAIFAYQQANGDWNLYYQASSYTTLQFVANNNGSTVAFLNVTNCKEIWRFYAVVYDHSLLQVKFFYDSSFSSTVLNLLTAPPTNTLAFIGRRSAGMTRGHFACFSAHSSPLNADKLLQLKNSCRFFHVNCSSGCYNGGTCVGFELCECPLGFYGDLCEKNATVELASHAASLPMAATAYWPFNRAFGTNDASGHGVHASFQPGVLLATGPSGLNESAFETLEVANGYVYANNSALNFGTNSLTVSFYAYDFGQLYVPFFEYSTDTLGGMHIWHGQSPALMANTMTGSIGTLPNCTFSSGWQFVAFTFLNSTGTCTIYCDTDSSLQFSCSSVQTFTVIYMGFRLVSLGEEGPKRMRGACYSLYATALSSSQLDTVKAMCNVVQFVCPANCAPMACYGDGTAPTQYHCLSCNAGWTGPDCSIPYCSSACPFNHYCLNVTCVCNAGWTGTNCSTILEYGSALASLQSLLPAPIGYWPFNMAFGKNEASGTALHAYIRPEATMAVGPFGSTDTAFETATTSNGYISIDHSAIDLGNRSFTIVVHGNSLGSILGQFWEYQAPTNILATMWRYSNADNILFLTSPTSINMPNCQGLQWQFLVATYDNSTKQCKIHCGNLVSSPHSCTALVKTSSSLFLGARFKPSGNPHIGFYKTRVACLAIYDRLISIDQLEYVRLLCPVYAGICSPNCAPQSCYGNSTSASKFSCLICNSGWTGSNCSTPICTPACVNGGTCTAPNLCSCQPGWTGSACDLVQNATIALQSLSSLLPSPVGYFPFNSDFGPNEATGTGLSATKQSLAAFSLGPFGAAETAYETANVANGYLSFDGSNYNFGSKSWSMSFWVNSMGSSYCPLAEFESGSAIGSFIWQLPNTSHIAYQFDGPGLGSYFYVPCATPGWHFIAIVHRNGTNGTITVYCDLSVSVTEPAPMAPKTYDHLMVGTRIPENLYCKLRIACFSMFEDALTSDQVSFVHGQCQLYSEVCPEHCASETCFYSTANLQFECTSCILGWTGPTCSMLTCASCPLNQKCINATCVCNDGWTGANCTTAANMLIALQSLESLLPTPVGFWPFNKAFGPNEATGTGLDADVRPLATFAIGPFGEVDTAIETTDIDDGYIMFDNAAFNFGTKSWTLTMWVHALNQSFCPMAEFENSTHIGSFVWQTSASTTDFQRDVQGATLSYSVSPCSSSEWQFVAAIYRNESNATMTLHCDLGQSVTGTTASPPKTFDTLFIGKRAVTYALSGPYKMRAACYSFYDTALNTDQLALTRLKCPLYSGLCPVNCAPQSCFYDDANPTKFSCTSCNAGWVGSTCSIVATCSPTCQNGGSCISTNNCSCSSFWSGTDCSNAVCLLPCENGGSCTAPNACTCTSAWSGTLCQESIPYPVQQLLNMTSSLPAMIGYWPMTSDFDLRDASSNQIDAVVSGNSASVRTAGPFNITDSAYKTGDAVNRAYLNWTNVLLDVDSQSFTLAAFVNVDFNGVSPIFEWFAATDTKLTHLWKKNGTHVFLNAGVGTVTDAPCTISPNWQFLALSFDFPAQTYRVFCNLSFVTPVVSAPAAGFAATATLMGGFRNSIVSGWGGIVASPVQFSCVSLWNAALTESQIITAKNTCPYFQSVTCGPGCAPSTCRAKVTALLGYVCDSCLAGWTGEDCTTATCSPPCSLNARCIVPGTCVCFDGWKGANCDEVDNVAEALGALREAVPRPVAYWPFNEDFTNRDISGNNRHATVGPSAFLTHGPFGEANTAYETASGVANGHISIGSYYTAPQAYTLVMFVHGLGASVAAYADFTNVSSASLCIWHVDSANYVSYYESVGYHIITDTCPSSGWHFVAYTYSGPSTWSCKLICDNSANVSLCSPNFLPEILIGARYPGLGFHGYYKVRAACYGIYDRDLSIDQLQIVRQQCNLFSAVCPEHCAASSCLASYTDLSHFTCSACQAGWTGSQCDAAICSYNCSSSGNCTAPDQCTCLPGYTGLTCGISLNQWTSIDNELGSLPSLLAYWPLTSDFMGKDISGNDLDGIPPSAMVFTVGPYGGPSGAMRTGFIEAANRYLVFDYPALNLGASSWSLSMYLNIGSGSMPLYEYDSPAGSGFAVFWQLSGDNVIHFYNGGSISLYEPCLIVGVWQYFSFVYSASLQTVELFCNGTSLGITSSPMAPGTGTKLLIGYRTSTGNIANGKFACISLYTSALNITELERVRNICPMFANECNLNCTNGGTCMAATGTCSCPSGWTGGLCETPVCLHGCINGGTCINPNICSCDSGWSGINCSSPTCTTPCQQGTCSSPDTCTCIAGWAGSTCNEAICNPECYYGSCSSPDVCSCSAGFTGRDCSFPLSRFVEIRSLMANRTPTITSFWPLSIAFGLMDIEPNSPINGKSNYYPETYAPGLFNALETAFSTSTSQFAFFNSSDLDFGPTSSATIAIWTFMNTGNIAPILEFDGYPNALYLWHHPAINILNAAERVTNSIHNTCTLLNTWQFVALTYDRDIQKLSIFCDDSFIASMTLPLAPVTSPLLYLGYRPVGPYHADASVACMSMYSSALNQTDLLKVKGYCSEFHCQSRCQNGGTCIGSDLCSCAVGFTGDLCETPFVCSNGCLNGGTCTADEVCTCEVGFSGDHCQIATCEPPCQYGGSCTATDVCTCLPEYTGLRCGLSLAQLDGINDQFSTIHDLLAYWPLNSDFMGRDATNSSINGTPSSTMTFTTGPFGGTNKAMRTGFIDLTNKYLVFDHPSLDFGASSWTMSMFLNVGAGDMPLFEFVKPDGYSYSTFWQLSGNDIIHFLDGGSFFVNNPCPIAGTWQHFAFVYSATAQTAEFFCNEASLGATNLVTQPLTGSKISIGYRFATNLVADASFACISLISAAVNSSEIVRVKNICPMFTLHCTVNCTNGGSCMAASGTCLCPNGWSGALCEIHYCTHICANGGACTGPNICTCQAGWTGPNCTTPICTLPCQHGDCSAPDTCNCVAGWTGHLCDSAICIPQCHAKGGNCSAPPDICSCNIGWIDATCSTPICTQVCENNGTCFEPDWCSCPGAWGGQWCDEIAALASPEEILELSDEELLANLNPIGVTVQNTAENVADNILVDFETAKEVMAGLGAMLDRFGNISSITPVKFNEIAVMVASAADTIMEAATNATEGEEQLTMGEGSMRCKVQEDGSIGKEITKPAVSPSLTKEKLREIFNKFMGMLVKMFGNLRQILSPGMNMTFSGQFYGATVFNLRFGNLPGYHVETNLAAATFQNASRTKELFEPIPSGCPAIDDDTTVPVVLSAFIVNVMNVDQPFNMPTIAVRVYCSPKVELALNKSLPMRVVAKPSVNKAEMFARTKVSSQCDISKTSCTKENADTIGSLAVFPLTLGAGDFALIFPVIEYPYIANIMLGDKPDISTFTWKLSVDSTSYNITANGTFPTPEGNLGLKDLRLLLPEKTLLKFLSIDSRFKSDNLKLNVYMKRNFSAFTNKNLPDSACDLQRAYGYHLRIKLVEPDPKSNNTGTVGRRRRETDTTSNGFELMPESNESAVVFKSKYFGDFGADLVISPNTIEFSNIFQNFATLLQDNAAVFSFQIVVVVGFVAGLFFAFHFDKIDIRQWAFLPIVSNKESQKYHYYVSVHYSRVKHFESQPRIQIRLLGSIIDTPWRMLRDGVRKNFEGKHPENFILSVAKNLGRIDNVQILAESLNAKSHFSMHLDRIVIIDAQTGQKFVFIAKTTLKAFLPALKFTLACEEDLKGYAYLISGHSRNGVTSIHPWLSIAQRPIPSNWTRVERLACVVSALFMAMLVNAMFYGRESESPSVGVKVGNFFTLSWFTLWTSFIGAVIVIPPISVIAFIFKKVDRRSKLFDVYVTSLNMKLPVVKPPVEESDKNMKKPLKLPYKCVIIAWILVAACVGTSAFLCIMFSLQWGRDKSLAWLSGMVLNIIQDIILIQPVKILLTAIFSATLHSLPDDGNNELGFLIYNKRNNRHNIEMFKKLRGVIVGLCHHIAYVIVFGVVIATMTNRYSYIQIKVLRQYSEKMNLVAEPIKGTILNHGMVLDWLHDFLVPSLLNGNQLEYGNYYTSPKQLYERVNPHVTLLGPIRIRQKRVVFTACPLRSSVAPSVVAKYANLSYETGACQKSYSSSSSEETRSFNLSWWESIFLDSNQHISAQHQPWVYRASEDVSYFGWENLHSTGGFYVDLPRNMTLAMNTIAALRSSRWLDNATSVLFVDFNLFNIQTNLYIPTKFTFEALEAGGLTYHMRMFPLQLYQYSGASSILTFTVQCLWVVVLLSHIVRLALAAKKSGGLKIFFKTDAWNILDALQILMGVAIVGLFGARIYLVIQKVTEIQTMRSRYVNLDFLANWEDLMFNFYGVTFFLTLMLFFRHLKFNKHWCVFIASLSKGKAALATYSALFMAAIVSFAALAYLIMGSQTWAYSSFTRSCLNLVQGLIGIVDYQSLTFSRFYLALVMLFSAVVLFIGANIFVAIIMEAYSDVTNDAVDATDWDAELSDFISKQIKSIGAKSKDQTNPKAETNAFKPIGFGKCAMLEQKLHAIDCLVKAKVQKFMLDDLDSDEEDDKLFRSVIVTACENDSGIDAALTNIFAITKDRKTYEERKVSVATSHALEPVGVNTQTDAESAMTGSSSDKFQDLLYSSHDSRFKRFFQQEN